MANAVILIALAAILVFGAKSYAGKLAHGCCGGESGEPPRRVRVADKDASHYPIKARAAIAGMTCKHCALRVENALNGLGGVWAKVDLANGTALVRMKSPVSRDELARAVAQAGYSLTALEEA